MEVRLRFVMEHAIQDSNLLAELSGQAPAVLLLMATYGDPDGQNIRVSVSRLAANLGVSRDTIERAQKTLREAGLLAQVGRTRDGVCKYTLTLPGMDAASKPAPVRHNHVPSNKHKETIGGISPSTSPRTTRFARSTTPSVSSLADNATPKRAPVKKAVRPSIKPSKTTKPDVEGIARRVRAMKAKRDNKNTPPTPSKPLPRVKKALPPHTLTRTFADLPTAKPEPKETRLRKKTRQLSIEEAMEVVRAQVSKWEKPLKEVATMDMAILKKMRDNHEFTDQDWRRVTDYRIEHPQNEEEERLFRHATVIRPSQYEVRERKDKNAMDNVVEFSSRRRSARKLG